MLFRRFPNPHQKSDPFSQIPKNKRLNGPQINRQPILHDLTREFHVKFHAKKRYRKKREAMSAISVFQVKFNVEFTSKTKRFPFYFTSRASAETKETLSKSMRFLVLLSVSGFLKF